MGFVVFGVITNWARKPVAQLLLWQLAFMLFGITVKMVLVRPVRLSGSAVMSGNWLMHALFAVSNIFLTLFATGFGALARQAAEAVKQKQQAVRNNKKRQ